MKSIFVIDEMGRVMSRAQFYKHVENWTMIGWTELELQTALTKWDRANFQSLFLGEFQNLVKLALESHRFVAARQNNWNETVQQISELKERISSMDTRLSHAFDAIARLNQEVHSSVASARTDASVSARITDAVQAFKRIMDGDDD